MNLTDADKQRIALRKLERSSGRRRRAPVVAQKEPAVRRLRVRKPKQGSQLRPEPTPRPRPKPKAKAQTPVTLIAPPKAFDWQAAFERHVEQGMALDKAERLADLAQVRHREAGRRFKEDVKRLGATGKTSGA